jgi:hypothetical protein
MNIKVFVHATDITGEIYITLEQIGLLRESGLLDESQEVRICTHYDENSYSNLKYDLSKYNNITFKHFGIEYKDWYEYTTCLDLQRECEESEEDFYALYLHNKGAFTRTPGNYNWRKYMQYFCVERWEECVQKLDEGYDTCGASFLTDEPIHPYYAGNFFWAKSSYINKCKRLVTPPENDFKDQFGHGYSLRFDLEIWHGSGNPKWYDMHPGERGRWYLPPETYRI